MGAEAITLDPEVVVSGKERMLNASLITYAIITGNDTIVVQGLENEVQTLKLKCDMLEKTVNDLQKTTGLWPLLSPLPFLPLLRPPSQSLPLPLRRLYVSRHFVCAGSLIGTG